MAFTIPVYETLEEISKRLQQASQFLQNAIQAVAAATVSDSLYRKLGVLPPAELTTIQELFAALDDHCADAVELINHTTLFAPPVTASRYDGIAYIQIDAVYSTTKSYVEAFDEDGVSVAAFTHITAADTVEIADSSIAANDGSYTVDSISGNKVIFTANMSADVAQDTTVKVILRAVA